MNIKKIFCWPPLLAGIGAGVTIGILGYITYESVLSPTNYGLWLLASFGSTVVVVFGYPNNEFAQPKNIFFGHLLTALVGIIFVTFFEVSFFTIGLAVGISILLMIALKVTHPPAGGNPIMVIIGSASFDYLINPIIFGCIIILLLAILVNKFLLQKNYPLK